MKVDSNKLQELIEGQIRLNIDVFEDFKSNLPQIRDISNLCEFIEDETRDSCSNILFYIEYVDRDICDHVMCKRVKSDLFLTHQSLKKVLWI